MQTFIDTLPVDAMSKSSNLSGTVKAREIGEAAIPRRAAWRNGHPRAADYA